MGKQSDRHRACRISVTTRNMISHLYRDIGSYVNHSFHFGRRRMHREEERMSRIRMRRRMERRRMERRRMEEDGEEDEED